MRLEPPAPPQRRRVLLRSPRPVDLPSGYGGPMSSSEPRRFTRSRMWAFKRVATRYVDPILLPIVAKLPSFGIVTHRGRKSGRIYHTQRVPSWRCIPLLPDLRV